jgi:subtilisin family serine protease
MGSYNFGNTKHGFHSFASFFGSLPPFNAASARHRYANNPFYNSTFDAYTNITMPNSASYNGEGVDIVVMDTGVDATHPEFFDTSGNTRVVSNIDWYAHLSSEKQSRYQSSINNLSNFTGQRFGQACNYYGTITDNHGTVVASASAGIKHGYAKGARIIDCRVRISDRDEYYFDANNRLKFVYLSTSDAMEAIVNWKNSRTGSDANRPVIVNMSFGSFSTIELTECASITYRGTTTNRSGTGHSRFGTWQIQDLINAGFYNAIKSEAVMSLNLFSSKPPSIRYPIQFEYEEADGRLQKPQMDTRIKKLTDAGIHVTKSAGNSQRYRVPPGHADYDNFITHTNGLKLYWCRGDQNRTDAIICGASKARTHQSTIEAVERDAPSWTHPSNGEDLTSFYSGFGPGIDLYAVSDFNWQAWPSDMTEDSSIIFRNYKTYDGSTNNQYQERFFSTGGTSTAAPVIAGLLATYLERYPTKTPAQAKTDMKSMGLSSKIHTITDSTVFKQQQ